MVLHIQSRFKKFFIFLSWGIVITLVLTARICCRRIPVHTIYIPYTYQYIYFKLRYIPVHTSSTYRSRQVHTWWRKVPCERGLVSHGLHPTEAQWKVCGRKLKVRDQKPGLQ
jgi:hypothetical protein